MKKGWKTFWPGIRKSIVVGLIVFLIAQAVLFFYTIPESGFSGKTLWDWMELLLIPMLLAAGAFSLNRSERVSERRRIEERTKEDRKLAEGRAKLEREITTDRQQEAALQAYLDRMADLLLKENLRTGENKDIRDIA